MKNVASTIRFQCAAVVCAMMLVASGSAWAAPQAPTAKEEAARAAAMRKEVPDLPHLVRTTPNIYVIRVEKVETPDAADNPRERGRVALPEPSRIAASVVKTVKGKTVDKLDLEADQRRPGAADAGLYGGDVSADPSAFQKSPAFFSPQRFLSARNPMIGGPYFEKGKTYLVFLNMDRSELLGGPYGYQEVKSENAFWVQTVRKLVGNPNQKHAVTMSYPEFIKLYRSAFLMVIGDCLGTEVSISEPLWGKPVRRKDINPDRILPESAAECAGALDEKRGYLGLIEAEPYLYQLHYGYPNQAFVEIDGDTLDFSRLGLDIGLPSDGKITVDELVRQLSEGPPN